MQGALVQSLVGNKDVPWHRACPNKKKVQTLSQPALGKHQGLERVPEPEFPSQQRSSSSRQHGGPQQGIKVWIEQGAGIELPGLTSIHWGPVCVRLLFLFLTTLTGRWWYLHIFSLANKSGRTCPKLRFGSRLMQLQRPYSSRCCFFKRKKKESHSSALVAGQNLLPIWGVSSGILELRILWGRIWWL